MNIVKIVFLLTVWLLIFFLLHPDFYLTFSHILPVFLNTPKIFAKYFCIVLNILLKTKVHSKFMYGYYFEVNIKI